ncbi:hypothetical protein SNEBB_009952 [Seison nebaliae]|nr:hypothetical protein SNEBB_009952 [Seison nebaliae]
MGKLLLIIFRSDEFTIGLLILLLPLIVYCSVSFYCLHRSKKRLSKYVEKIKDLEKFLEGKNENEFGDNPQLTMENDNLTGTYYGTGDNISLPKIPTADMDHMFASGRDTNANNRKLRIQRTQSCTTFQTSHSSDPSDIHEVRRIGKLNANLQNGTKYENLANELQKVFNEKNISEEATSKDKSDKPKEEQMKNRAFVKRVLDKRIDKKSGQKQYLAEVEFPEENILGKPAGSEIMWISAKHFS